MSWQQQRHAEPLVHGSVGQVPGPGKIFGLCADQALDRLALAARQNIDILNAAAPGTKTVPLPDAVAKPSGEEAVGLQFGAKGRMGIVPIDW